MTDIDIYNIYICIGTLTKNMYTFCIADIFTIHLWLPSRLQPTISFDYYYYAHST